VRRSLLYCLSTSKFFSSSICLSLATFLVFLCARNYIHTSVNILYLVCPVFLPVLQHLHRPLYCSSFKLQPLDCEQSVLAPRSRVLFNLKEFKL
jgi:hypothetical protein